MQTACQLATRANPRPPAAPARCPARSPGGTVASGQSGQKRHFKNQAGGGPYHSVTTASMLQCRPWRVQALSAPGRCEGHEMPRRVATEFPYDQPNAQPARPRRFGRDDRAPRAASVKAGSSSKRCVRRATWIALKCRKTLQLRHLRRAAASDKCRQFNDLSMTKRSRHIICSLKIRASLIAKFQNWSIIRRRCRWKAMRFSSQDRWSIQPPSNKNRTLQ